MFNSFSWKLREVTGLLLFSHAKPILRSVIALPGIVAGGGGRTEKAPPKQRWRDGISRMHHDATANENKILHLEVR
jgi:hypothetical protein